MLWGIIKINKTVSKSRLWPNNRNTVVFSSRQHARDQLRSMKNKTGWRVCKLSLPRGLMLHCTMLQVAESFRGR